MGEPLEPAGWAEVAGEVLLVPMQPARAPRGRPTPPPAARLELHPTSAPAPRYAVLSDEVAAGELPELLGDIAGEQPPQQNVGHDRRWQRGGGGYPDDAPQVALASLGPIA